MNTDNLIPTTQRTEEEVREMTRKGGIKSGETRRKQKTWRELLSTMLSLPLKNGELEEVKCLAELKGKNITTEQAILFAQITKAIKGDTKSAEFLRDTSGNKPKEYENVQNEQDALATLVDAITGRKRNDDK